MTDEELAIVLCCVADDIESFYADNQPDQLRQAAARLRELSRDGERYRVPPFVSVGWMASRCALCSEPGGEQNCHGICIGCWTGLVESVDDENAAIDQAMEKKG